MVRAYILLFILLLPTAFTPTDDVSIKHFYLSISKEYCSDAPEILESAKNFKDFTKYAKGDTKLDWLKDYGTAVHETCHRYNWEIAEEMGFGYQGYFITSGIKIAVFQKSVYNSVELNNMVPDSIQKRIFRYDAYIARGANGHQVASQIDGVYGMLNEFCAYYHGTKAQVELYSFYDSLSGKDHPEIWTDYFRPFVSELYSYYEFKLFISWYLQYARKYHDTVYNDCMSNKPLRVAYTLLDNEWMQLQKDYRNKRHAIIDKLNKQGLDAKIKKKELITMSNKKKTEYYFTIGDKTGVNIFDEQIEYLTTLLQDTTNRVLNKFRMEGVTINNYDKYLGN